jgi:hypothetical protein
MHYQSEKRGERIFNIRARGMLIASEEEDVYRLFHFFREPEKAGTLRPQEPFKIKVIWLKGR